MATERFTKAEFEAALPSPFEAMGLIKGEEVYRIAVDGARYIEVRSSIDRSGVAADAGDDSIRAYIMAAGKPLGKDVKHYTTRVAGWERRVRELLETLYDMAIRADYCPKCHKPRGVRVSQTPRNPNRPFASCPDKACNDFAWLDKQPAPRTTLYARTSVADTVTTVSDTPDGQSLISVLPNAPTEAQATPLSFLKKTSTVAVADDTPRIAPKSIGSRKPNAEQQQAIDAPIDGAVRVLAGPGSGKTFTISFRYAHLVASGVRPDQIVAVTFSSKMADELLARILGVSPDLVGTAAEQQVCTIHALCYRILRAEGLRAMVAKTWQIKRAIADNTDALWERAEDRPGWEEACSWIDSAKSRGLTSDNDRAYFIDGCGQYHGPRLHELRKRYDAALRDQNLTTFADMLLDVDTRLQRDVAFRIRWQTKYTHIIIDEGQDTSEQAMRVLTTLAQPQDNLFIVGDADQLLYRFSGATPEANLFDGFTQRYPTAQTVKLVTNYRSTRAVVESQLTLIANNYDGAGGPYPQGLMKTLTPRPDAPDGLPVDFGWYDTVESEAEGVATAIAESIKAGTRKPADFFVGARTRAQLGYLEAPLMIAGVPFINLTGGSFWSQSHVADVIGYVQLAHDPTNRDAFKRVYNIASNWFECPFGERRGEYITHRYLGKAFLETARDSYTNVWYAVQQKRSYKSGVEDLVAVVQDLQAEMAQSANAGQAVQWVIDNVYAKWLKHEEGLAEGDAESGKLEDLDTVVSVAATYKTVEAFLKFVSDAVAAAEKAANKDWSNYVVISTVHRLKGLERPVVYGVGLCEGVDDPIGLLPHTFSLTEPPQKGVLPTGGKNRVEDERCIAFVLVSRAQDECHLSGFALWKKKAMMPSRFVEEMGLRTALPVKPARVSILGEALDRDENVLADVDENWED